MILLATTACKKEQEKIVFDIYYSGAKIYGSLTALKNGIKWEASGLTGFADYAESLKRGSTGVFGNTYADDGIPYKVEHMSFDMVPNAIGKYKLHPWSPVFKEGEANFLYGYDEDDVTVNPFELVPEADNFIEVTKIDSLHIEGRFDVTCKGKYKIKGITHIYRFSEGKFNVIFRK
jgi:hypothetical protein